MSNVIEIGDFSFARASKRYGIGAGCHHQRMTLELDGEIVRCRDCKAQVTAWWALNLILQAYEREMSKLASNRAQIADERKQIIHLIAARKVERAWKSKDMVPTCPHCRRGILPTDGLGDAQIHRQIDKARRIASHPKDSA